MENRFTLARIYDMISRTEKICKTKWKISQLCFIILKVIKLDRQYNYTIIYWSLIYRYLIVIIDNLRFLLHNKWNTAYEYNKLKYLYLGAFIWDVGTCIRVPVGLKMWYISQSVAYRDWEPNHIDAKEISFAASFDFALSFYMLTLSIKSIRKNIMYVSNI